MVRHYIFSLLSLILVFCCIRVEATCPITINAGGPVVFCSGDSVLLSGGAGPQYLYQWKKNNINIAGATAQNYYAKTTGDYKVTVTVVLPACTATSNAIHVAVELPLTVSVTEAGATYCGASTDLLQASPYSSTYLYQWFEDTIPLLTSGSDLYIGHNATYSCAITNTCGTFTSAPYTTNYWSVAWPDYGRIVSSGPTSFCAGSGVTLEVFEYLALQLFDFQWYRNSTAIPGATNPSYTTSQQGNYAARITTRCEDGWGDIIFSSNWVPVTVLAGSLPTAIISAGSAVSFCMGSNVILSVDTATGWSYQWRRNNLNITGATSSTYMVSDAASYRCVVSNNCGGVVSNPIITGIIPTSVSISAAGPTIICNGTSLVLNATTAGSGGAYQWKWNGNNVSGATSQSYTTSSAGSYSCTINNSCGNFSSNTVSITISDSCATGMQFDGNNDCATIPNHGMYSFGTGEFTIEAWVNLYTVQQTYATIISLHNSSSFYAGFSMYTKNGKLYATITGRDAGGGYGQELRDNSCHHVAISRSGGNTLNYFIDGILVSSHSIPTYNVTTNGVLQLGRDLFVGNSYLRGRVMELRMWDTSRTQTEIQNSKDIILTGSEPGLVGYWRLNEGGGQVMNDYSPTNNDGQLGELATPDFRDPSFFPACELTGCPLIFATITANKPLTICGGNSITLTAGPVVGMTHQWKKDGVDIAGATANTYTTSIGGNFTCAITNACGNIGISNALVVTIDNSCYNGLYFDGIDDAVIIPNNIAYNLGGNFIVEAWVRDDASQSNATVEPILSNWGPGNTSGIQISIADGRISFYGIAGLGPDLRDGKCHHIAVSHVSSPANWWLHVDGILVLRSPSSAIISSTLPLLIGAGLNSSGGTDYFKGLIREVRVWNSASGGNSEMDNPINGALNPSLVGYWRFNEGTGQISTDYSTTANNGMLGTSMLSESQDPKWSSGCPACPVPSVVASAGGPITFCFGENVTLNASPTDSGCTYQWRRNGHFLPGDTLAAFIATSSGDYDVLISNNNCISNSNKIPVIVNGSLSTLVLQPGSAYGMDAMVSNLSGDVSVNYGSGVDLKVDAWAQYSNRAQRDYIRFDLSSLPAHTSIEHAELVLYNSPTANLTGGPLDFQPGSHSHNYGITNKSWLQKVMMPWNENTVTWNTQPAATIINQVTLPQDTNPHQDYLIDVTDFVQEMVADPAGNHGWKLRLQNESYSTALLFASSDYPDSTKWPKLTIIYYDTSAVISASGPTSICAGGGVSLRATPDSGASYQWKFNGSNITGATSFTYDATMEGNYTCEISGICTSAESNAITISFTNVPPLATVIAGSPPLICSGDSVMLNANTGIGLSYQWQRNGADIAGATAYSYAANTDGNYSCRVTNTCDSATSNAIAVTIVPMLSAVIAAGGNTTFCTGGSVLLNANSGTGLTYQWRRNSVNISGATFATYTAASTGDYTCTVANNCGSTISNTIIVTKNAVPAAIITAGGPTTFCTGSSVMLNADTGQGLTYQWKLNGGIINGATTSSYSASAAGTYTCQLTNGCGSSISNAVTVVLNPMAPATITAGGITTFCSGGYALLMANTGTGLAYQWQKNGSDISGATTYTYLTNAAGNYTCMVTNNCGATTSNAIAVTLLSIPPVPGTIVGQARGICGNTISYSIPPVPGATVYNWTVPAGVTVNSGLGTASLNVTFPAGFTSGNISVNAENECGIGAISTQALNSTLAAPGPIFGLKSVCALKTYVYSINPVEGATSYNWTVPLKTTILHGQGSTAIEVRLFTIPGNITVTASNACSSSTTAVMAVTLNDTKCGPVRRDDGKLNVEVYPNPSSTEFELKIFSDDESPCMVIIRDVTGRELERMADISPGREITFGNRLANGIYLAEVIQGEERMVLRVVKSQ